MVVGNELMNMTFGYTNKHVLLSRLITNTVAIPVILNSPRQRWAGFSSRLFSQKHCQCGELGWFVHYQGDRTL